MLSTRSTSVIVGALFITATAGYVGGQAIYGPLFTSADPTMAADQRTRLMVGVFVELVGVLSIPLIAAFLFPVLKRFGEGVALGYLALRTVEALLLLVAAITVLAMADASRGLQEAGPGASAFWEDLIRSLELAGEWPFLLSVAIIFPLSAMLLNSVLYRGRLVPRPLAAWGLLAGALLVTGSVLDMVGLFTNVSRVTLEVALSGPIAIQEMVLAGWLIAKGFEGSALGTKGTA